MASSSSVPLSHTWSAEWLVDSQLKMVLECDAAFKFKTENEWAVGVKHMHMWLSAPSQ